jgi:hypothetical protein
MPADEASAPDGGEVAAELLAPAADFALSVVAEGAGLAAEGAGVAAEGAGLAAGQPQQRSGLRQRPHGGTGQA